MAGRTLNAQALLLRKMRGRVSAFDHVNGNGSAIVEEVANIPIVSDRKLVTVGQGLYNPAFKAQIQINVLKLYFTKATAGAVYTVKLPANLDATLKVSLPVFLFSNSDFSSGFTKLKGQFPIANWVYRAPFIYNKVTQPGTDAFAVGAAFDANVKAQLKDGDLVMPFTAVTAVVGEEHNLALIIVRTSDVPYGNLLDATNSNTFVMNMIRYTVLAGQETQFANAILASDLTMFGKFSSDPINPESYKSANQEQNNIIEIDIEFNINKQKGLATLTNFDVVDFRWNLFISSANKVQ